MFQKEDVPNKGGFTYKTLITDTFIDSLRRSEIKKLFGNWTISAIAKTGGSGQKERIIQNQLGKRLHLDSNKVQFALFDDVVSILNPSFSIEYLHKDENSIRQSLEGSTLFYGYGGLCRKVAPQLIVSNKLFFEVLNFSEMTTFADGRIYFLTKE